jgi:hypothetical protein
MASTIQHCITELDAIKLEIKRNNDANKRLRERSSVLENQIKEYMEAKEHTGLKYKDQAITIQNCVSTKRKVEKNKRSDIIEWLRAKGIQDPEKACGEIKQLQQGEKVEVTKIKIKGLKNKETY